MKMIPLFIIINTSAILYVSAQSACSDCQPLSKCPHIYKPNSQGSTCKLSSGKVGFCCPEIVAPKKDPSFLATRTGKEKKNLDLPTGWSENVIEEKLSAITIQENSKLSSGAPKSGHNLFNKLSRDDREYVDLARKILKLGSDNDIGIGTRQGQEGNGVDSENSLLFRNMCPYKNQRKPQCDFSSKYRKADGSCNNRENPLLGMRSTPLQRIAPAEYKYTGDFLPRVAKNGFELPSARFVRTELLNEGDRKDTRGISTFFVQMGQFIDHDITRNEEEDAQCCDLDSNNRRWKFPSSFNAEKCFPIRIPENDPVWGPRGRTCIEFIRSVPSIPIPNCRTDILEQINRLTTWLDASNVYGSSDAELRDVRESGTPFLKIKTGRGSSRLRRGRALLPRCSELSRFNNEIDSCTNVCEERDRQCLVAGDHRVNEQPGLTTMHTIWLREHNRLAGALENDNPSWDTERVFQEARRILTAEWQHIIYGEWLPILLGDRYMRTFNLLPLTNGFTSNYDETLDPRINNEFSTAAFRFGHSMMPRHLASMDRKFQDRRQFNLNDVFNNASLFAENRDMVDNTARGQIMESASALDAGFNQDITEKLFEEDLDLPALNIQRGRDHGIPGYNTYRGVCASGNYKRASTFEDLTSGGFLNFNDVMRLKEVYDHVDDIDLWVGGIMETPHQDSLVGPAFKCIIGDQFIRLKEGDRFWYETEDFTTGFTGRQLNAIKQVSMARIVCDNTDIDQVTPLVFRTESGINRLTSCSDLISIPELDLNPWREK